MTTDQDIAHVAASEKADVLHYEDLQHSAELSTDLREVKSGYFSGINLLGAVASISFSTTATYWAFIPATSIIVFIDRDIGPSPNPSQFAIVWTMASSIGFISTALSDKLGRRWFVIGASLLGLLGGIIACRSTSMNMLIGANVLLGLGGGLSASSALTIGEMMPHRYKFVGISLAGIANLIPYGFGSYLARRLVETSSWRWIYYIYIIIMVPIIGLQYIFYKPPTFRDLHGPERSRWTEVKRIDFVGIALLAATLALILLGLSWGGQAYPWTSGTVLGPLITGFVCLAALITWEIKAKIPNRILPMEAFGELRGFAVICWINAAISSLFIGLTILWPQQVTQVFNGADDTWQKQAWLTSTIFFAVMAGVTILGLIFHLLNIRAQVVFWTVVGTAFAVALMTAKQGNIAQSAVFAFLAGLPVGFVENASGVAIQLDCNDADIGRRFAVLSMVRTGFAAVMSAVFVAILSSKIPVGIQKILIPDLVRAGLPESSIPAFMQALGSGSAAAFAEVPGYSLEVASVTPTALAGAYSYAYKYVYYAMLAIGITAVIAGCFLKDYNKLLTGHIPRTVGQAARVKQDAELREDGMEVSTVKHEAKSDGTYSVAAA